MHTQKCYQPPSGGCVLKHTKIMLGGDVDYQPPSGGCVLKRGQKVRVKTIWLVQPPSGGCVLKLDNRLESWILVESAAFGRLRVETRVAFGK